jgi:hypothetical protein
MLQNLAIRGGGPDPEPLQYRCQLGLRRCSKIPVLECFFYIPASVGGAVAAQLRWSVLLGVEADAEQMRLRIQPGIGAEFAFSLAKLRLIKGQNVEDG